MSTAIRVSKINDESYEQIYVGPTAAEAVICAHAQDKGDHSTWDYDRRYGHLLIEAENVVICGDFIANRPIQEDGGFLAA